MNHKDAATLAFMDDREQLMLLGRQVLRRVMNEAVDELRAIHNANVADGRITNMVAERTDIEDLFLAAVKEVIVDVRG